MLNSNTDNEWEKFGKIDPYRGVLGDKFSRSNLTDSAKKEFFSSGYIYIDSIIKNIKNHFQSDYKVTNALDFGCGVGRLVIPLATIAENVTGVDVSESMIDEAKKNCEVRSLNNISFVKADDDLSRLKGKYNLIHSFIVFQHIPAKRGERIFQKLMTYLKAGGIGVIHFTYAKNYSNKLASLLRVIPGIKNLINLLKGRPFFDPQMQMNNYDLNKLFLIIQNSDISNLFIEYTDHAGDLGVILYFQKK